MNTPQHSASSGDWMATISRSLVVKEGWLSVFLVVTIMMSTVWSVEASGWVSKLPSLSWIALVALTFGFVFARMRFRAAVLHSIAFLYGVGIVTWQTMSIINLPTWEARFVDLVLRLNAWGYAARTGGINNDSLVFVFTLVCLTWLIGYLSAWFVFRSHRIWWGVVPSGVAILTNLRYAPPNVAFWFVVYLFASMLLLIRMSFYLKERDWEQLQIKFSPRMSIAYFPTAIILCFSILTVAWLTPTAAASTLASEAWHSINEPWQNFQAEFDRMFASLSSQTEDSFTSFGRNMILRGPVSLSSKITMVVGADEPHYWRATSFDTYVGRGWVNGETMEFPTRQLYSPAYGFGKQYQQRKEITQTVSLRIPKNDIIIGAGQPLRLNLNTVAQTVRTPIFTLDLSDRSLDANLPFDLRRSADPIRRSVERARASGALTNPPWPTSMISDVPPDYEVVRLLGRDSSTVTGIELMRSSPYPIDVVSLRAPQHLKRGQEYTVVSSVSVATERQLRSAGTNYPNWVTDRYVQVPSGFPRRVAELAESVTRGIDNPYDKTLAIQNYLRQIKYNQNIDAPPATVDPVEYFLFTSREGYCDYYASAMVMMLRTVGIPARVATGYLTGTYDEEKHNYVVRESNAHAWPEVFFPRYGWIEFEPTASVSPIVRAPDPENEGTGTPASVGGESEDEFVEEEFFDDFSLDGSSEAIQNGARAFPAAAGFGSLLAIAVLAALVWLSWQRGIAQLALPSQVYEKMCRLAGFAGLGPTPSQTPYEYSDRLGRALPGSEADVSRIAGAYTAARFGRKGVDASGFAGVETAWRRIRGRLLSRIFLRR